MYSRKNSFGGSKTRWSSVKLSQSGLISRFIITWTGVNILNLTGILQLLNHHKQAEYDKNTINWARESHCAVGRLINHRITIQKDARGSHFSPKLTGNLVLRDPGQSEAFPGVELPQVRAALVRPSHSSQSWTETQQQKHRHSHLPRLTTTLQRAEI